MDNLLTFITSLLDTIFYSVISPLAVMFGTVMELLMLKPLELLHAPPALQVGAIAVLTAAISLFLRYMMKTEEKEQEFRTRFVAKKEQQNDLHRIGNWHVEEKLRKSIDDDIDEDFNTYLAGRFARYGIAYLLPVFLVLYWLQAFTGYTNVPLLPESNFNHNGVPVLVVFMVFYGGALYIGFRKIKKKRKRAAAVQHT